MRCAGKEASQSSTFEDAHASKAVDGNAMPWWSSGSVSQVVAPHGSTNPLSHSAPPYFEFLNRCAIAALPSGRPGVLD
jgi:hypothetical protein